MSEYELELGDVADSDAVIATLSGELDLTNARELEERLNAAAPADSLLVVDVNRVTFVDSAALHVFFKVARRRGEGGFALVMEPQAPISRTVEVVGLHTAARVVSTLQELRPSVAN